MQGCALEPELRKAALRLLACVSEIGAGVRAEEGLPVGTGGWGLVWDTRARQAGDGALKPDTVWKGVAIRERAC